MSQTPTILRKILARKLEEVAERRNYKNEYDLEQLFDQHAQMRGFTKSIEQKIANGHAAVIAEIKKASPSKGVMRDPFVPEAIAESYQQGGAACLSVLTDRDFFQGHEDYLVNVRKQVALPVIRKDFIVHPYQITEARAIGADCVLLIVAALDDHQLKDLHAQATELGMDVLIEVHNASEMESALTINNRLIGINNRDLHTFDVSLQTTLDLQAMATDEQLLVTESGIMTQQDVNLMRTNNVHAFLVGEAFMRAEYPGEKLAELFGG